MREHLVRASLLACSALGVGCATVTTGSAQSVAVITEPPGADCTLTRESVLIGRVNPTPGVVQIGKSPSDVEVTCNRDGYEELKGAFSSTFQAATLGNVILGGLIGVVVDAASGAMTHYPDSAAFTLSPIEYPTTAKRDQFFDDLRAAFISQHSAVVARIKQSCAADDCEQQLSLAEAVRRARIEDIERRRSQARVRAAAPLPQ